MSAAWGKRMLLTVVTTLMFGAATASAQWVKHEDKDAVTEKIEVTYELHSKGPEKAVLIASCFRSTVSIYLFPHFQIKRDSDADYPNQVRFAARFDSEVHSVIGGIRCDLDDCLRVVSADDPERIMNSKRIVLQVPQFGAGNHDLIFTADHPPALECKETK